MNQANIISYDLDPKNGAIRVWTQYIIDDVEVDSPYPKINDKFVYLTRYSTLNFYGMDDTKIKDRILQDLNQHLETLIIKKYTEADNDKIVKTVLGVLDNLSVEKETATIKIDTATDKVEIVVKTDGTKVSETVTPKVG
jgi:hypothetical protein